MSYVNEALKLDLARIAAQPLADTAAREVQAKYDPTYRALGAQAGPRVYGEPIPDYEKRLLRVLQPHSKRYAAVNLDQVRDPHAVAAIAEEIRSDVLAASRANVGPLRAIVELDAAGRRVTHFVGGPGSCWNQFKPAVRYVQAFDGVRVF